jgi:hypothetical protein
MKIKLSIALLIACVVLFGSCGDSNRSQHPAGVENDAVLKYLSKDKALYESPNYIYEVSGSKVRPYSVDSFYLLGKRVTWDDEFDKSLSGELSPVPSHSISKLSDAAEKYVKNRKLIEYAPVKGKISDIKVEDYVIVDSVFFSQVSFVLKVNGGEEKLDDYVSVNLSTHEAKDIGAVIDELKSNAYVIGKLNLDVIVKRRYKLPNSCQFLSVVSEGDTITYTLFDPKNGGEGTAAYYDIVNDSITTYDIFSGSIHENMKKSLKPFDGNPKLTLEKLQSAITKDYPIDKWGLAFTVVGFEWIVQSGANFWIIRDKDMRIEKIDYLFPLYALKVQVENFDEVCGQ